MPRAARRGLVPGQPHDPDEDSPRRRRRRPRGPPHRSPHQPRQGVLPRAGHTPRATSSSTTPTSSAYLLPHLAGPRHRHEALSQRHPRAVLLHEARPGVRARRGSKPARSMHKSASVIDFPMVQDLASLLWLVNLGCIDLNQWYARVRRRGPARLPPFRSRSRSTRRPFEQRARDRAAACATRSARLGMKPIAKTSGASGIHVYVPIVRGPEQKEVWTLRQGVRAAHGAARIRS